LTLDALEHAMLTGDAQALEDLIRKASSARSAWQIGGAAR
jgi:prephenate dehydrogenase